MNELELYVDSLDPSLSNEEKVRLVQEWKKANRWKEQEVEVSEQVDLEEVDLGTVKKKDGVAGADVPSVSAAPKDTDSQLENIFSELVVPENELLKINEKVNSLDLNTSVQTKRTGGKFSQSFDVDIIPYEEQRIQAKKILEEQGLELDEQAIQNQMRELIRQQEEDRYKAREHDKNAPGFFSLDTVKKIASTAGNIFSGSLRGESGLNKIIARTFYGKELDAIEKQYAKDSTEEAKAVNNLIDDSYFGVVKDVGSKILSPQYSAAKEIFENLSGEDVDKLALDIADKTDAYVEDLDKGIFKYKMGVTESFSDAIEQGDFSGYVRALTQATKEAAGSAPYMAVAAVPGGLGIIGVSTAAGGEFKENSEGSKAYNELINLKVTDPDYQSKKQELEEKIKNGQISLQNLAHHTVVGVSNSIFERWSGRLARNFFNTFKNQTKDVFEKNLKQYVLGFVKASGGEGLTEATQTAIEKASNAGIQGKEVDFQEAMQEIYDAAIIGTVSGAGPSGASNSINILKTGINNKKEKSLVKEAGVSNAVELFEGDIKPQGLDFTSIPNGSVRIDAELDLQVSNGQKTTEEANAVKNRYREVQGAVNQLKPLDISIENQPAMVDLMIEQKNLQQKIKEVDNSSLTKAEAARLAEIDTELGDLITKDKSQKIDVGAKKIAEEIGVGFESFETQEDVDSAIATLQEEGGEIDAKNSDNYGTFITLPGDKSIIILNKETATEDRMFTEGQHETGHAVIYETVKNKPEAAIALGQSLLNEIRTNKDINIKPGFQARLDQYIQDADISQADTMEEVMTLVSDGLTNGTIEINETIGVKLGNFIRRALSAMGMKVKFKNGKDVLNFIKDYNRSVYRQKGLSRGLKKTAIEGAEVAITPEVDIETEIKESVAKESKRVEDSQEVQRLYDEQGVSAAMDIIEKFKPITSKIVESRSQAPNFDRQLLTDEIETGKRGILDLVMEYKPESGVPLAAYINKFLPARAIEASQRVLGEEFTADVTEAKGVVAEEVTEVVEEKPTKLTKPSSLLPSEAVTEITEQVKEKIKGIDTKSMTFKKLGDLAPEVIASEIGIPVKKLTDPRANLSKGDATAIQQFVNKNADKLLRILPEGSVTEAATDDILGTSTGVPTGLLKAFYTKGKRSTRGAGLTPFIKNKNISKADFLEAFGIVEGKKAEGFSARSPQAQALKGIASLYGRLVTNEVSRSPEVGLKPETKQRIAAGKAKTMASKRIAVNEFIEDQSFEKNSDEFAAENKIWKAIVGRLDQKALDPKNEKDVAEMQKFVLDKLAPELPKSFFTTGTLAGAGISAPKRNFFFTSADAINNLLKEANFAKENLNIKAAVTRQTYVTGGASGKISSKFLKLFNTSDFKKQQEAKLKGLEDIFIVFEKLINEDINNARFIAALLSSTSQGMGHFVRTSAPIKFYSSNISSGIVEEHTLPASLVAKYLFGSALNGTVKKDFKNIKNNYFQGALAKADDKKLKGKKPNGKPFNYTAATPEGWKITDNIWARYFNINVAMNEGGIDPSSIILSDGKTVFDKFNVMSSGLVINEATKKQIPQVEALNDSSQPKSLSSKRASTQQQIYDQGVLDEALAKGRRSDPEVKKIRVFDFDDTLATSKSQVIVTMPLLDPSNDMVNVVARRLFKKEFENLPSYKQNFKNLTEEQKIKVLQEIPGKTKKINATQFAAQAAELEAKGATFDFTEFSKVVDGKKGPLFNVAKKIADTRGTEDLFILTARPQDAAGPIKAFMKSLGVDIPLKNITGLGDGTAQAKGMWIAGKAAEGYNDFYFADDATKNVKAVKDVLDQIDVKSRVQIAKASKRKTFDTIVNDMIFDSSGIETYKQFSAAKAKTVGANKGKYNFLIPASAEDFTGLLYKMLGKGKKGDAQMAFLKTNLLDPYMKAEDTVVQAKISAANDFMALKQQFPGLPKTFRKETGIGGFTYQHAIRTYIWTRQGMSIPGLSKADIRKLNAFIKNDPKLQAFADQLISIQKGKLYPEPGKDWLGGNLTTDIIGGINKVIRAEAQQEFRENLDIIFSPENLNKMEAAYGTRWRRAMEDSIRRMKAGTNRPIGSNPVTEKIFDWLNNSVGAVMFLNTRSALLQTISAVNFINWGDNNIVAAGKAFANQPQYWKDFMSLMNSDYLTQRRNGLKINVSESEIADAVKDSKNKPRAAIAFLLSKGFVMTRFADSFAIASGGATFYRNRIKKYIKEGMDQKLAEEKAFDDFRALAEESQQSSDPSKISMQQASAAGRVILAWANTPMQYARIQKRSAQDLIAGRGDWRTHVSKIAYYGFVQNLIFNALQQALFAIGFGDSEDEEEDAKKKALKDKKIARVANGMIDSQLKGLGIAGTAVAAVKNMIVKLYDEHGKKTPEYEAASVEALGFSPPLNSKYRKLVGGLKSFSWNRKEMKEKGFSLDNPAYLAGAQIISAFTNVPVDRVVKKANNIRGLLSNQTETWQKVALGLGWGTYDIGLPYYGGWDKPKDPTPEEIKQREFDTMKKDTKTSDQVQMLLDLGLDKKQIKALRYEDARVKKIIELQNKKKDGITTIRKDK